MTTSNTQRFLNALVNGQELSTSQISARFGLANVTAAVSKFRRQGYAVYANRYANGITKYRIGTPRRAVVAAGYAALGA